MGAFVSFADLLSRASDPGPLERPLPIWFWNGSIDPDTLIAQIGEMERQGIQSFLIHSMPSEFRPADFVEGLTVPYLGDEYFEAVKRVVEEAASRGMKIWIHDEGGWPSGSNVGRVVHENADLAGVMAHYNEAGQIEVRKRGYAVDLLNPETTRTFIRQVHERYAEVVGTHFGETIQGMFTEEPRFGGRVGGDEIPWTEALAGVFKEKKGYELRLGLPILFGLKAAQSLDPAKRAQVICAFYHVVTQLWRDSYFRILQEWCTEHDLALAGHLNGEEKLVAHVTNGGDFFKAMECVDWPGIDVVSRQIHPDTESNDFPKFASSAAHLRGRTRVVSESFAGFGWGLTPDQMKWITNYQVARGVNAISLMAFYADITGPRKVGTMSDLFQTNPLWPFFRKYADYTGRLMTFASAGKPVVDVGVYYPVKSLWVGDGAGAGIEDPFWELSRALLDQQIDYDYLDDDAICRGEIDTEGYLCVGDCRYNTILFPSVDIIPIETLRQLRALAEAGGTVMFLYGEPGMSCKAAGLEEMTETIEALERFQIAEGGDMDVVLSTLPRTVRLAHRVAGIRAIRRTTDDGEVFILVNESMTAEQPLRVRLPAMDDVCSYDLETEQTRALTASQGYLRVTVPANGAVVLFAGEGIESDDTPEDIPPTRTQEIEGPFTLTILEQWSYNNGELRILCDERRWEAGVIERPSFRGSVDTAPSQSGEHTVVVSSAFMLDDWSALFWSSLSGCVEYSMIFDLPQKPSRVVLDLGKASVAAEVVLNDVPIGYRTWSPYEFDVTDAVRGGINNLSILVTSTLEPLMSDGHVLGDMKSRGWYNSFARTVNESGWEKTPSGLFGPITLRIWE
jgi:hypothetical protein